MTKRPSRAGLVLLGCVLACTTAGAQDSPFVRKYLPQGISLEVPKHWAILSEVSRQNLEARTRAINDSAGQQPSNSRTLLAMNATPAPSGAMIRVSVSTEMEYTTSELQAMTAADLRSVQRDASAKFKALERPGDIRILKVHEPKIEKTGLRAALLVPYERTSLAGPANWTVHQHYIPLSDRIVIFTLSYRQSDAPIWKPILDRVKKSLHLDSP